ncbi:hypothetical protein HMPREF9163_02017 [Selenomonas sp. oral taxon 138 str. F0429]|nr:hypothetical protein HMPREF9163_02017 [Selenomonas sp. oral taxon 138 str. F0429]
MGYGSQLPPSERGKWRASRADRGACSLGDSLAIKTRLCQ